MRVLVTGGAGYIGYGLYLTGTSPMSILMNTIDGGSAGHINYGVYIDSGSSPTLERNVIKVSGQTANIAVYILGPPSAPILRNNLIDGGSATYTMGVHVYAGASPKLYNNTIDGGDGANSATALNLGPNSAEIVNNIIFTSAASGYCVEEAEENEYFSGTPELLMNNDLFDCGTWLYGDWSWDGFISTPVNINSITTINAFSYASQNVSADPMLIARDGDAEAGSWDLTSSSPDSVKFGGADLTAEGFITDYDGAGRVGAWSMGAYEF